MNDTTVPTRHFRGSDNAPEHPCGLCCRDWQVDTSTLLCRTCVAVDSLLAQRAGATHFLPHVISGTLQGQPSAVMTCALYSAKFPNSTGFYGVYTTMSSILSRCARERRLAMAQVLIDSSKVEGAIGIEATIPQPTHEASLIALTEAVSERIGTALPWLQAHLTWATQECARLDKDEPPQVSDFASARLISALVRLANIAEREARRATLKERS